ncbi:PAS domain S-box protein [Xanthobacteraceae bacterium A53D]
MSFTVADRRPESRIVTSFLLKPDHGTPVPPHRPGQHLTLKLDNPDGPALVRDYTVSCAPNGEHLRISVKREPNGTVSRLLHDELKVGDRIAVRAPSGDFVLPQDATRPLVLVSAGVGITPMVAMLEAAAAQPDGRLIHFIHGARDAATRPFAAHVADLARRQGNTRLDVFYSRPEADEDKAEGCHKGRISLDFLSSNTPLADAAYFLCGPMDFLREMANGLAEAGVARDRIHYEFFGPMEEIFAYADSTPSGATGPAPSSSGYVGTDEQMALEEHVARALLESAADAVVASDAEGLITVWNAGAERIFGFSLEEAVGQSLDIIIPEQFRARHWEGYHQTVSTGESRYGAGDLLAVPGLCKDGRRISIEFTIVLMKDGSGTVTGMASTIRDVSKRFEETRALKKKLAELEKAAGGA